MHRPQISQKIDCDQLANSKSLILKLVDIFLSFGYVSYHNFLTLPLFYCYSPLSLASLQSLPLALSFHVFICSFTLDLSFCNLLTPVLTPSSLFMILLSCPVLSCPSALFLSCSCVNPFFSLRETHVLTLLP